MNNFKFFPEYSEGYKNNGSKKYKKGDLYKINNEDVVMSRKLITEITSKLTNQNNKFSKFYYITHIDNLNSILKKGIKPRNYVINRNYSPVDISNANVQRYRDFNINLSDGINAHIKDCVPLFFTPLHPMLYVIQNLINEIVIISISIDVLRDKTVSYAFSDKNAADSTVNIYNDFKYLDNLHWDIITGKYWSDRFYGTEFETWKENRMAEFFIYPDIGTIFIEDLICANSIAYKKIESVVKNVCAEYPDFYSNELTKDIKIIDDINLSQ